MHCHANHLLVDEDAVPADVGSNVKLPGDVLRRSASDELKVSQRLLVDHSRPRLADEQAAACTSQTVFENFRQNKWRPPNGWICHFALRAQWQTIESVRAYFCLH